MQSVLNSAVDMLQQGDTFLREENAVLRNHVEILLKELAELNERIDQHDVTLATRGMMSHPFMTKDVPKPKPYKGFRNAREIDNFLWSMEVYFDAADFETMHPRFKLCLFILKTLLHCGGVGDMEI